MTQGDSQSYLEPGRNLLHYGVYFAHGQVELDRTPAYPIFAALTGAAFGNTLLTIACQVVLASLTILVIHRITRLSFSKSSAGLIAAWLFALEPVSIASTIRIMPETLFVFLITLAIEHLLIFRATANLKILSVSGILLASATYVRPVSYYLVVPLVIALAITYRRKNSLRWKAPAVLLVSTLPLLAAWQFRNARDTGYAGFSSIVEKNLYYFQSAEVTAELNHISLASQQIRLGYTEESLYLAIHPEQKDWPQAQRLRFMRTSSIAILSQHPALYLRTHLLGVGLVAFTPAATEFLQLINLYPSPQSMPRHLLNEGVFDSTWNALRSHPFVLVSMICFESFLAVMYLLAIWGGFLGHGSRFAILTLVGIATYFLLISGGAQAVGRYRLPIIPELCVLAAGGFADRTKKRAKSEDLALLSAHRSLKS
jgi:4-amino-4-deoxy-L-arabinose transferase-like glycosyltransferase